MAEKAFAAYKFFMYAMLALVIVGLIAKSEKPGQTVAILAGARVFLITLAIFYS